MVSLRLSAAALVAVWLTFCGTLLVSSVAAENAAIIDNSGSDLVAEMRRSFTLHCKTIPPEIFRDFGDGDLADSGSIWVTVDVAAAIDSNLYFDPIREVAIGSLKQGPSARAMLRRKQPTVSMDRPRTACWWYSPASVAEVPASFTRCTFLMLQRPGASILRASVISASTLPISAESSWETAGKAK